MPSSIAVGRLRVVRFRVKLFAVVLVDEENDKVERERERESSPSIVGLVLAELLRPLLHRRQVQILAAQLLRRPGWPRALERFDAHATPSMTVARPCLEVQHARQVEAELKVHHGLAVLAAGAEVRAAHHHQRLGREESLFVEELRQRVLLARAGGQVGLGRGHGVLVVGELCISDSVLGERDG